MGCANQMSVGQMFFGQMTCNWFLNAMMSFHSHSMNSHLVNGLYRPNVSQPNVVQWNAMEPIFECHNFFSTHSFDLQTFGQCVVSTKCQSAECIWWNNMELVFKCHNVFSQSFDEQSFGQCIVSTKCQSAKCFLVKLHGANFWVPPCAILSNPCWSRHCLVVLDFLCRFKSDKKYWEKL